MNDVIARIEEARRDLRRVRWDDAATRRGLAGLRRRQGQRRAATALAGAGGAALAILAAGMLGSVRPTEAPIAAGRLPPRTPAAPADEIRLGYGTRAIALGPTSELAIREEGPAGVAVVLGRGAGRFEVAHLPGRRFQVEAGPVTVTALGSRFSVALLDERAIVSVISGRVVVEWAGGRKALGARDSGLFPPQEPPGAPPAPGEPPIAAALTTADDVAERCAPDEPPGAEAPAPAPIDPLPAAWMREAPAFALSTRNTEAERARADLFVAAGFRRAIVEVQWQDVEPDDPGRLGWRREQKRGTFALLRERGVRPIILVDAYSALPRRPLPLALAEPAPKGARHVRLDPASAARVVPGRTLLEHERAFVESVAADGVATLTRGLPREVPAGPRPAAVVVFPPFPRPLLADGAPNPAFEEPMNGWLRFVAAVLREARDVLGDDGFDLLLWNGSGSPVLDLDAYHDVPVSPPEVPVEATTREILKRTVQLVRAPTTALRGVRIIDGFTSRLAAHRRPGAGVDAYSRHVSITRRGLSKVPQAALSARRPLFPEVFLTALAPVPLLADRSDRPGMERAGSPLDLNITAFALWPDRPDGQRRAITRTALRALTAYVGAGSRMLSFYEADESTQIAVEEAAPGGGETLHALGAFLGAFEGPPQPRERRPLRLAVLDACMRPRALDLRAAGGAGATDRDPVLVYPFQRSDRSFVLPAYVRSLDVSQETRPRTVVLRLDGIRGEGAEVLASDPVTGGTVEAEVLRRDPDGLDVRLELVDHPRLLQVTEAR